MSMASIYGIENSIASHLLEDRNEEGGGTEDNSEEEIRSRSSFQIGNSTPFEGFEEGGKKSLVSVGTNQEESEFGSYNDVITAHLNLNDKTSSNASSRHSVSNREANFSNSSSFGESSSFSNSNSNSNFSNSQSSASRRCSQRGTAPGNVRVVLNAENGEVSELGEDLIRKLQRTSSKNLPTLSALTRSNVENLKSAASVMQSKHMGYGLGPSGSKKSVDNSKGPFPSSSSTGRYGHGATLPGTYFFFPSFFPSCVYLQVISGPALLCFGHVLYYWR